MASRAAPRGLPFRRTSAQSRTTLSFALRHALDAAGASHRDAADWLRVSSRTVGRWARGEAPLDVEVLMTSWRLWPPFLRCLVGLERKARRV